MEVRMGLIGYGLFGQHHARSIQRAPNARLVTVATHSAASQQQAAADHPGIIATRDFGEILQNDSVDAVCVVTPNHTHHQIALAAIEAGKHVLVEKPMALTVNQCDELIEAARRRNVTLAVGHELRLSSLWGGVKQLIDDGKIGTPRYALVELSRFPYRTGSAGWRYDPQRVGNWILEEPVHFFDLACWYLECCGAPQKVTALASGGGGVMHDNFSALVRFPNQAYAMISQTLAAFGHHQTVKITGDEAAIWAAWSAADARSPTANYFLQYGKADDVQEISLGKPAGELHELDAEICAFVDSVRNGTAVPCNGADGRTSVALCLAAQVAVELDREVNVAGLE